MDNVKVIMLDALSGNDYSVCLCSGLDAVGVNVSLIVPEDRVVNTSVDFAIRRLMPPKNTKIGKIKKAPQYLKYLTHLLIYVTKNDIEVVHFQFFRRERIESIFFLLLRLLGINLVFTAHNVLPHESSTIDHLFRFMVYRSAKIIIVHSEYVKNKLARNFKIDREKIRVIRHGNFDIYLPRESVSKVEARASLNLSEKDNVALFFGFIREYKGLDLLLDAFQIAIRHNKRLKLVIAGTPRTLELENRYRKRIAQISTDGSIVFHPGFIPSEKVATYFVASDVVILPYERIDHSGIVHLAYSFGRPLIATNVGDLEEVIEDGKSGFLLKENSADCLANTVIEAFSKNTSLENMGTYARELSETKYSWVDVAHKTKTLYESVVNAT
jgi:glycosyltransferase involved in cell wall biosynthesis